MPTASSSSMMPPMSHTVACPLRTVGLPVVVASGELPLGLFGFVVGVVPEELPDLDAWLLLPELEVAAPPPVCELLELELVAEVVVPAPP